MPRASVIIPTHNRADLLPRAIKSVLSQSLADLELIVVDDASGDDTAAVVAGIRDPRLRYLRHDENRGVAAARNTGIQAAVAPYIAFLDDDDEWMLTKLEKQVQILDSAGPTVGGVYTGFRQVDRTTGRLLNEVNHNGSGPILKALRAQNCIGTASTVVLRRQCFDTVGLFDDTVAFGEEYDMWIRIAQLYEFRCIREPLVLYSVHDLQLTSNARVRIAGLLRQLEKHNAFFQADPRNHARRYRMLGMLYADLHEMREARRTFRLAVRTDPFAFRNYMYLLLANIDRSDREGRADRVRISDRFSYRRRLLRALGSRMPAVRALYRRFASEIKMVRHAARNNLWRITRQRKRAGAVPKQRILSWDTHLTVTDGDSLSAALRSHGLEFSQGGHAVYVPPQRGLADLLGGMVDFYPSTAGYKILKNVKGPDDARYLGDIRLNTLTQSAIVGRAVDLIPVANRLTELGISPRLYDVAALTAGQATLTAFVVEHVPGTTPTEADCRRFLARVHQLVRDGVITLASAAWERSEDFRCPGCSGNLLTDDADGSTKYVDFQNFLIPDHEQYLRGLLTEARDDVHFGDQYAIRGGRYLYQQIPGLVVKGSRDTDLRWERMDSMLNAAGGGVEGRVVLDVGCNTGMMLAGALSRGALWGVGWDREKVTRHGRRLLAALGYTRWDLISCELSRTYALDADLPDRLQSLLPESVVCYLAIRHHVGFLDALARMPWRYLVYEGAQEELGDQFERISSELTSLARCERVSWHAFADGDSAIRPLAIFRRIGD